MAGTSLKTSRLRNKTIVPEACNLSELLENEKLIMKYISSSIAQSFNDQLTLAVNV